jgi:hypothetical protein
MSTRDANYKPPRPLDISTYNPWVWGFRYKIQYEEPRVRIIQEDPLVVSWSAYHC